MTAGRPEGATRGESKDSRGSGNGKIVTEDTEDADTMMMIRMMMCAGARGGPWLFILLGERNPAAGRRTGYSDTLGSGFRTSPNRDRTPATCS